MKRLENSTVQHRIPAEGADLLLLAGVGDANLQEMAKWVRQTLDDPGSDEERSRTFADRLRQDMRRSMGDVQVAAYPVAAPFEQLWLGLARYWRKRTG